MRHLAHQFGYEIPVMPIGGKIKYFLLFYCALHCVKLFIYFSAYER